MKSVSTQSLVEAYEAPARDRILAAAFEAFTQNGYGRTSTLEIATRARVSKRELYALFGNKHQMLVTCIAERTAQMKPPGDLPPLPDRHALAYALKTFGIVLLREISDPLVIAMFRLAIAEAERAPEVAQALDTWGRSASHAGLADLLVKAQSAGLLDESDPKRMAICFMSLLWEDLLVGLIMGVAKRPSAKQMEQRAATATEAFLRLYPEPCRAG